MDEKARPHTYIVLRIVSFHCRLNSVSASGPSARAWRVPYCACAKGDASASGSRSGWSDSYACTSRKSALDSHACASSVVLSGGSAASWEVTTETEAASSSAVGVTGPGVMGDSAPSLTSGDVGSPADSAAAAAAERSCAGAGRQRVAGLQQWQRRILSAPAAGTPAWRQLQRPPPSP